MAERQKLFFPSCNFSSASPEAAKRIRRYLSRTMEAAGCCRVDEKAFRPEYRAVYFCQACRERIEEKTQGSMECENLFSYLDRDPGFSPPDYSGLTVNVQDCWRDREHPEIFQAVRSLLQKMKITVVELEECKERSAFCGDLHFEPKTQKNKELLARYPGVPLYQLPEEVVSALMREQVEKYTCPLTVCYCNRCVKGVLAGGGAAVHLLELAMGTFLKAEA